MQLISCCASATGGFSLDSVFDPLLTDTVVEEGVGQSGRGWEYKVVGFPKSLRYKFNKIDLPVLLIKELLVYYNQCLYYFDIYSYFYSGDWGVRGVEWQHA